MARLTNTQKVISEVLREAAQPLHVSEIVAALRDKYGDSFAESSIRSSLRLQSKRSDGIFTHVTRGVYALRKSYVESSYHYDKATLIKGEAFSVMSALPESSIHAIVTDPPYGLVEYDNLQIEKMRSGKGGVWRIPPSFDGSTRAPLPRFTESTVKPLA